MLELYSVRYAIIGAHGVIERTGECSLETLYHQIESGQQVVDLPDGVTDETHYWDGEGFIAYPPRPGPWNVWDGAEWIDPRTPEDHAAELVAARQAAIREITAIRGAARLAYITDIPGQDMLYMAKMEEAREYIAATDPDPADYPLIASEVGVTAPTADEVAQVFLNLNALWRYAAGQIDAACFQAEGAVMVAPDAATITAIVAGLRNALAA